MSPAQVPTDISRDLDYVFIESSKLLKQKRWTGRDKFCDNSRELLAAWTRVVVVSVLRKGWTKPLFEDKYGKIYWWM
jgi:hypothetical protein